MRINSQLANKVQGPKPVMASFKLTYLNYRGRAELIRFILCQAKVEFEDVRLNPQEWNEIRPSK